MDDHAQAATRRAKRMARVDAMSPELRALVHEHGLTIVDAFLTCGVTKPRQIRHLIEVVRTGSVEIGDRSQTPLLMRPLRHEAGDGCGSVGRGGSDD